MRADGRTVYLQQQPLLRVDSASLARLLAARLRELAQLPPPKRPQAIDDFLNNLLDTQAIAARYERVHRGTRTLKWTGTVLFLYLFAMAPALLLANAPVHFVQLLAGYGVLLVFSCVHFVCVHAWLYPGASAERWKQVLTMLLSPADALRLRDCLFRELLTGFHPLAVAQVLCPRPVYEEFARRVVLDIHFPPPADQPLSAAARSVERWFRERLDRAVEALVQSSGLDPADMLAPPAAEGPDCRSYCPRCRGQFIWEAGVCAACTLPLRPLAVPGQTDGASG